MGGRFGQIQQFIRLSAGTALLLGHGCVAAAVCWRGREGLQALVSAAGGLGMVVPLIAVGAVFALSALWDAFRAKHASERVMAAVAVTWVALWGSLLLTPPPVWEAWVGYDRLAAILSSTSAGGVPLFAFSYTLVFAGFTLYVLRPLGLGAAEPNGNRSSSPHVLTWCRGAAFLAGFAGILHFATGTFGG